MNAARVRSGSFTYPRPTQTPEKTISPGAPSGTGTRCSSTTYTRAFATGRPSGTRSPSGARSMTSWFVSSEVHRHRLAGHRNAPQAREGARLALELSEERIEVGGHELHHRDLLGLDPV